MPGRKGHLEAPPSFPTLTSPFRFHPHSHLSCSSVSSPRGNTRHHLCFCVCHCGRIPSRGCRVHAEFSVIKNSHCGCRCLRSGERAAGTICRRFSKKLTSGRVSSTVGALNEGFIRALARELPCTVSVQSHSRASGGVRTPRSAETRPEGRGARSAL